MRRDRYYFGEEPLGARYDRVLELGLAHSATLGVIVQKWRTYPPNAVGVLERLDPYMIDTKDVDRWPGTRMARGYVEQLRLYRYDGAVKEILVSVARSLYEWQNPGLPDDLHLLRQDESVWLGSIAHEGEAWLELSPAEYADLGSVAPDIAAGLERDDEEQNLT